MLFNKKILALSSVTFLVGITLVYLSSVQNNLVMTIAGVLATGSGLIGVFRSREL
ncbi:hypothetical protein NV379_02540 [Paenibacillus sp. N1-5-1-14]|uniref:hypothetical protein n=1 Tax=Paenibacillus radicibacter TaxID=2972488 RepID=UPI0021590808|nr:hypothetical protein [Paenibacillus radicibacter]MCR8641525.1 hypothetical protein [Paenibacillus radicibacter]